MNPDGSFRGQVYPQTASVLSGVAMQNLQASPAPFNGTSNDQYIFAAKPTTEIEPTPNP
jgi:hypothetical protein